MVGKWGSETRKGKHLIKGDLSNKLLGWVPEAEFSGETFENGAKQCQNYLI